MPRPISTPLAGLSQRTLRRRRKKRRARQSDAANTKLNIGDEAGHQIRERQKPIFSSGSLPQPNSLEGATRTHSNILASSRHGAPPFRAPLRGSMSQPLISPNPLTSASANADQHRKFEPTHLPENHSHYSNRTLHTALLTCLRAHSLLMGVICTGGCRPL